MVHDTKGGVAHSSTTIHAVRGGGGGGVAHGSTVVHAAAAEGHVLRFVHCKYTCSGSCTAITPPGDPYLARFGFGPRCLRFCVRAGLHRARPFELLRAPVIAAGDRVCASVGVRH